MIDWEALNALITRGTAEEDEQDGRGAIEGASGEPRPDVEHCALAGFYSIVAANDQLIILRRDDGGVSLGAKTDRPSGAQSGDRGIVTSAGLHVRCRGTEFRIDGSAAASGILLGGTTKVMRTGDLVTANTSMAAWITAVSGLLGMAEPTDFGKCAEGSNKVRAG